MKVFLQVEAGEERGKVFTFEDHDLFILGRSARTAFQVSDPYLSRLHFMLEINPPFCRLRDLGSKNGTYVNGRKYGGRPEPEKEGARFSPSERSVVLCHGDEIRAGQLRLRVAMEGEVFCSGCGRSFAGALQDRPGWQSSFYLCPPCRQKGEPAVEMVAGPSGVEPSSQEGLRVISDVLGKQGGKGRKFEWEEVGTGSLLSRYECGRLLGEGTVGKVYFGRHRGSGVKVAVKVIRQCRGMLERAWIRFEEKAVAGLALQDENILPVYEWGKEAEVFWVALEFAAAGDLGQKITGENIPLPLEKAESIMWECVRGLAHAHEKNIVHRGLKPSNILFAGPKSPPPPKIADFGLAAGGQLAGLITLTGSRQITAALPYLPAEILLDFRRLHPQSDVFALGAIFYHILSGRFVYDFFPGKDPFAVILEDPIIPLRQRNRRLPSSLAEVIDQALAKDPRQRFPSAVEMKEALEEAL